MDLIVGPSRGEFDAALSHEHLARLDDCSAFTAKELDALRDELVGAVHRASSLQVTDPIRHLRPLIDSKSPDPALVAKRLVIGQIALIRLTKSEGAPFQYPGEASLQLGTGVSEHVLDQKLVAGGLQEEIDYMHARARAAEYNLMEDVERRPQAYPELLRQIVERVHGELSEAHLRARQQPVPYGPRMLIDAQDRLRRLAEERPQDVGHHRYECLIGVAGLLTSDCRVWWSSRFAIHEGATR
jgi:hypothetical protein